jgi:glycosyltransferase involved in cell wall biosynthesis
MTKQPVLVHILTVPLSLRFLAGQQHPVSEAGFDMHIVCSPGPLADEHEREHRVPVHRVLMVRRIAPWKDLVALARLCATLSRLKPRVVHSGTPKAGLLGTLAACLLRVPVRIYHVHGLPALTATGLTRRILMATERVSCAAATHVVCVSPSIRDELVAARLCTPDKVVVLGLGSSNGVDTAGFAPQRFSPSARHAVRARIGVPLDALVVGFIGRLVREKGIEELCAAWTQLRDRHPSAYLLIVGPEDEKDPVSPATTETLRADPRVCLTGPDWDVAPLYAAMDLFCLPSYREGCPNVLLEAAAMELAVVAARVPGTVDAMQDGVTGSLVEVRNPGALAEALDRYLADANLRRRHGRAGRGWVEERFSRDKVWRTLRMFYSTMHYYAEKGPRGGGAVAIDTASCTRHT